MLTAHGSQPTVPVGRWSACSQIRYLLLKHRNQPVAALIRSLTPRHRPHGGPSRAAGSAGGSSNGSGGVQQRQSGTGARGRYAVTGGYG